MSQSRRTNSTASQSSSFGYSGDQRRSPRYSVRFDSLISSEGREGAGVLSDISYGGARLCEVSIVPPLGSKVTLYVFVQPVAPFEIQGHVIRVTESGFALALDPEIQQLVDDVRAIVSVGGAGGSPRRSRSNRQPKVSLGGSLWTGEGSGR